jgi:hypothetical protein
MAGADTEMPKCYLLAIGSGSSVDQHSNNITLFNMVEQLNFPRQAWPPPGALLPLEMHAYLHLDASEVNQKFELRFVLVGDNGLETPTNAFPHRTTTSRYRTRTFGLPAPPGPGQYELRVEFRSDADGAWTRDPVVWPLLVASSEPRPNVTH